MHTAAPGECEGGAAAVQVTTMQAHRVLVPMAGVMCPLKPSALGASGSDLQAAPLAQTPATSHAVPWPTIANLAARTPEGTGRQPAANLGSCTITHISTKPSVQPSICLSTSQASLPAQSQPVNSLKIDNQPSTHLVNPGSSHAMKSSTQEAAAVAM